MAFAAEGELQDFFVSVVLHIPYRILEKLPAAAELTYTVVKPSYIVPQSSTEVSAIFMSRDLD